jgi:hypothetical protein
MKNLTIQLKDDKGNIKEEKQIQVQENEILVMKYPDTMPMDNALRCFKLLENAIDEGKLIELPESISFEVIKIN